MTKNIDIAKSIRGIPPDEYGKDHCAHVLEMWKTYLGMTDRISDRRERANAFFVTLHTGVFTVVGFLIEKQMFSWIATICLLAGIPFSYLWYRLVRSYQDLNSAKFKVVHEIEALLPLKLFDAEWDVVGRGKDLKQYLPFTHIEVKVPVVFLAIHGLLAIAAFYFFLCRASGT